MKIIEVREGELPVEVKLISSRGDFRRYILRRAGTALRLRLEQWQEKLKGLFLRKA
jgi:hypothetical protein